METRTITEIKVYIMDGNPMTDRVESRIPVAISYDQQKLWDWANSLKVEPYTDKAPHGWSGNENYGYHKCFQKGSALEWLNGDLRVNENWGTADAIERFKANNQLQFI